ncbi:hypothetical protein C8R47DRAFT_1221014 [Mycena vitilis]|nr:hypothetical protein C8R47DRAFT_1221014 [Mycena vitilis]
MDNPTVKKIVEFLSMDLDPLLWGARHGGHANTKAPILYDYHMPQRFQPMRVVYDPKLSEELTKHFVTTLAKRGPATNPSNGDQIDHLIDRASFLVDQIVPAKAIAENCIRDIQTSIHGIADTFATLACFDIDESELAKFRSVFKSRGSSGETNAKADLLVECQPEDDDKPTKWGSLWSSISKPPRGLRLPHFQTLYTEEFKNILAGNPRMILGIYIIAWCLEKGYLESFWPRNDCDGCTQYRKSHKAEQKASEGILPEVPVDSADATKPATDVEALQEAVDRLIRLDGKYKEKYDIPQKTEGTAKNLKRKRPEGKTEAPKKVPKQDQKRRQREESDLDSETDVEEPAEQVPYEEMLREAMDRASDDLELSEEMRGKRHHS